jgi:hypothetical protein
MAPAALRSTLADESSSRARGTQRSSPGRHSPCLAVTSQGVQGPRGNLVVRVVDGLDERRGRPFVQQVVKKVDALPTHHRPLVAQAAFDGGQRLLTGRQQVRPWLSAPGRLPELSYPPVIVARCRKAGHDQPTVRRANAACVRISTETFGWRA